MTAPLSLRYRHIQFESISAIEAASVDQFLTNIEGPEAVSYGARIVRAGGEAVTRQCVDWLSERGCVNRKGQVFRNIFTLLHSDSGARNSVTVHHTTHGEIELFVLVDKIKRGSSTRSYDADTTKLLLDDQLLDMKYLKVPFIAFRGVINMGDVVLLDHSQNHAVQSLSEQRISVAYY